MSIDVVYVGRPGGVARSVAPRKAHVVALVALAGCAASHGRSGDAGATIPSDAGTRVGDASRVVRDAAVAPRDARVRDAGSVEPAPCAPQDARSAACPEALCDGPGTWHWDGASCFWIDCGACEGGGCGFSWATREECEAAHSWCEGWLCRATFGTWKWWAEQCGNDECGVVPPATCEVGRPACDCGPTRRFRNGVGCFEDPTCPPPEPSPPDERCARTSGSWGPFCCDSVCGVACGDGCITPACDCGPGRVFDELRGCIEAARCYERLRGESCGERARCEPGTICCDRCDARGCAGAPTCRDPTCGDRLADACGNPRDAP